MWSIIIEAVLGAFKAALGMKSAPAEPSTADLAARAATAETQLHEEQSANDVLQEGAAARAGADARQLRPGNGDPAAITLDPAAPVNASPNAHFRD